MWFSWSVTSWFNFGRKNRICWYSTLNFKEKIWNYNADVHMDKTSVNRIAFISMILQDWNILWTILSFFLQEKKGALALDSVISCCFFSFDIELNSEVQEMFTRWTNDPSANKCSFFPPTPNKNEFSQYELVSKEERCKSFKKRDERYCVAWSNVVHESLVLFGLCFLNLLIYIFSLKVFITSSCLGSLLAL